MTISDRRRLQERVMNSTSGTITCRGFSPDGTYFELSDSYDSPIALRTMLNSMFDSLQISGSTIPTSPQSSDDSSMHQFNDDEDAAYLSYR
jgi:hypothetical protein